MEHDNNFYVLGSFYCRKIRLKYQNELAGLFRCYMGLCLFINELHNYHNRNFSNKIGYTVVQQGQ